MQIDTFLTRWRNAGGSERANYQLFIADLCALLEVEPPQPASEDTRDNAYVFERRVIFHHGDGSTSNGFIDCYRRAALIGERACEEAAGHIRWLRPDFQNPSAVPQGDFVPGAVDPQKRPAGSTLGVQPKMDLPEKTPSTLGPAVASMVATATERPPGPPRCRNRWPPSRKHWPTVQPPSAKPKSPTALPAKGPGRNACRIFSKPWSPSAVPG